MINEKVTDLLNTQVQKELYSSYLYLSFANYYASKGLPGFASWFNVQTKEELDHASLIRTYLLDNNKEVTLLPIEAPDNTFHDFKEPLELSLNHEIYVTGLIDTIYHEALESKDFRTKDFLTWFVKEQGEEEKNASDLIQKYELFASTPEGLFQLDKDLATRVYAAPSIMVNNPGN